MLRRILLASLLLLIPFAARADTFKQPDLISFGGAYFDFDKNEPKKQTADFRLEYRWGVSLLPLISDYFKSWDNNVQFHPYVGAEGTGRGAFYGSGGWNMDWYICRHIVFTWSEGVGLFDRGNELPQLGSIVEFRSMFELGYRFDNDMRLTAEVSHISNANFTARNPGAEIAGLYLHVPVSEIFGQ